VRHNRHVWFFLDTVYSMLAHIPLIFGIKRYLMKMPLSMQDGHTNRKISHRETKLKRP